MSASELTQHLEGMADSLDEKVTHEDIHRLLIEALEMSRKQDTSTPPSDWEPRRQAIVSALEEIRLRSDQYQAFGGLWGERHSAEDVPLLLAAVDAVLTVHKAVDGYLFAGDICEECSDDNREQGFPCLTVEVISAALGGAS